MNFTEEYFQQIDPSEVTNDDIFRILISIKQDLNQIKTDTKVSVKHLEEKVCRLEDENKLLKTKLLNAERKLKKNGVIIFGLEVENSDPIKAVKEIVNKKLNVSLNNSDINNCYQIKNTGGQPIFLELLSYLKKSEIFGAVKKLKGTGVSFTDDLTLEDRQERKQLLHHAKLAKERNLSVKIRKNKFIINGDEFTLADLSKINGPEPETKATNPDKESVVIQQEPHPINTTEIQDEKNKGRAVPKKIDAPVGRSTRNKILGALK